VWAGSQATKPLRLAGAVALAPLARRTLAAVAAWQGRGEAAAFATCTAACFCGAAAAFAAAVLLLAARGGGV